MSSEYPDQISDHFLTQNLSNWGKMMKILSPGWTFRKIFNSKLRIKRERWGGKELYS
jgi:hypothetical protein